MMLHPGGAALFLWAYLVGCTTLYAATKAALSRRKAPKNITQPLHLLVVRPCAGAEPNLENALVSLSKARFSMRVTCRLAVQNASDSAAVSCARAASTLRDASIETSVVYTHAQGLNHKASQLQATLNAEKTNYDAVIVADSDVDFSAVDLEAFVAPLFDNSLRTPVGAVWAPPVEVGDIAASGDRASQAILAGSLHAFTLLGALDSGALVGKLFAIRRDTLRSIGGFSAAERTLGEDMEIARLLAEKGQRVTCALEAAKSLKTGRSWRAAAERYARWITVIRAQRPHLLASYPLLFLATPILLLAQIPVFFVAPVEAVFTAAAALIGRIVASIAARALAGLPFSPRNSVIDAALSDALLAHAFWLALTKRGVVWRGKTLRFDEKGMLTQA
ncbi:MAG: glycosyltransferase [Polyangiaceae bacterium]|nr:glycosyltransferase [Polyangiaceae bacterium]